MRRNQIPFRLTAGVLARAVYDDYYMYGGGYMMGMEMGMMFGIMGASDYAYNDPMYGDYYGGDMGFDADEGFDDDGDFGGGDFDF